MEHRRKNLPEHAEVAALQSEKDQAADALVAAQTAVSDLELDTRKSESDLEPVRQRRSRNQQRIADGTVADPKALAGLVEEVEHLDRRIAELEDAELELMEQLEEAGAERDRLDRAVGEIDGRLTEVVGRRDEALSAIAAEVTQAKAERATVVADLPEDLLAFYDKIAATRGSGAAALRQRRCTGCRLELNSADLRGYAAAPVDEVLRCEECGRILVRTDESGI